MIVRLLDESGYVHCDLHMNNAMIKFDNDKLVMRLIDFGRVVYIDPKSIPNEIHKKLTLVTIQETRFNRMHGFIADSRTMKYIKNIIDLNGETKYINTISLLLNEYKKKKNTINSDCYRLIKKFIPKKADIVPIVEKEEPVTIKETSKPSKRHSRKVLRRNRQKTLSIIHEATIPDKPLIKEKEKVEEKEPNRLTIKEKEVIARKKTQTMLERLDQLIKRFRTVL